MYKLDYHRNVAKDVRRLPRNIRDIIANAIEDRLAFDPFKYSIPLKYGLEGFRRMRVGDYRIVFTISTDRLIIYKIRHRKDVYDI